VKIPSRPPGKFTGLSLELPHAGKVILGGVVAETTETSIYATTAPGIVVKMFDLACEKLDEISYGPFMGFKLELANYEEIHRIPEVARFVPAYHGAHVDYERKRAGIAMEFLHGKDLKAWCDEGVVPGEEEQWVEDFQRSIYETLAMMRVFHAHGIILLDMKPENIIRLRDGAVRFVDLGAFFTPKHAHDLGSFVYSATPEHAEVLIDVSNLQARVPPSTTSDVFSAGVALFELATGASRLFMNESTAQEILATPELYRFSDSQIRDVWKGFPHLQKLLPLVHAQLGEGRLLFADAWHVLKAYLARKAPGWETLRPPEQDEMLLNTGLTFIQEQLPLVLAWLAEPIARATILRSARLKTVSELMRLVARPIPEEARDDLREFNGYLQYLVALDWPSDFVAELNTWEIRREPVSQHWAIGAVTAGHALEDSAELIFLKLSSTDGAGRRFYRVVDEPEADHNDGVKLTLGRVLHDRQAWLA
jgi:serine/threonine protein kinase